MSTKFPSFAADTTEELWFNVDNPCDDEAELQAEEQKYQNWLLSAIQKDSDTPCIGESTNRFSRLNNTEDDTDDDTDDSNEEMEEEDLNDLPDSPDEQVIPEIDMEDNEDNEMQEDNSWMNMNL